MNIRFLTTLSFLFFSIALFSQQFVARTGHVKVSPANKVMNLQADNYQVSSAMDLEEGKISFVGLLKSFEFKLGSIDRVFNSSMVDVSAHPKFKYIGFIENIKDIDYTKVGEHQLHIRGILYVWDEKRVTRGSGVINIKEDGTIDAISDLTLRIEEKSAEKLNNLVQKYLSSSINITQAIPREINVKLDINYKASSPASVDIKD